MGSSRNTATPLRVQRADVLAFRWSAQGLDRAPGGAASVADVPVLDLGVQDTGPDGARWALELRGVHAPGPGDLPDDVALAWTLRGAPHAYRRSDLPAVAVATAPLSEADAAKRVISASGPLRAAGISVLDALRTMAEHERALVTSPTVKGELSTRLTERLPEAYVRWCAPCGATHSYEMTFRLAALQAGLEIEDGTSPPVLRPVPGLEPPLYGRLADQADPRHDVVRGYLRFLGPASVHNVAAFLDAPVRTVRDAWPADVVEVEVEGMGGSGGKGPSGRGGGRPARSLWVLADDADALAGAAGRHREQAHGTTQLRLAGPYDPFLQLRDRELLVREQARRTDLWRTLGRPGAVLADGEVVGTWRPRASSGRLAVLVDPWQRWDQALTDAVAEQAERLGSFRDASSVSVERASA
ncbi:winged helix DNA-binding domain-containing protein [Cellulosimicrobium terreum]|nr:winged helix DNA-binding domain-containing protein [Cellulosimicrobium terreum]